VATSARESIDDALAPPNHALSPSVCFHTYLYFADRVLDANQAVTACGRCFRHEGLNFHLGERLWDFSMREIVFVGDKTWVEHQRQRGVELSIQLVKSFGMDAWIENASDPFFLNNYVAQRYFQRASLTKLELHFGLPYSGKSIAVASYNAHSDFFGRSFGIRQEDDFAQTACIGFGIERWVWAMFAQFGADFATWPGHVKDQLSL
jgi:seryl-tRNA synthetase